MDECPRCGATAREATDCASRNCAFVSFDPHDCDNGWNPSEDGDGWVTCCVCNPMGNRPQANGIQNDKGSNGD